MRKLLIASGLFLFCAVSAFAQMQKGAWIANGSLAVSTRSSFLDTNYPDYQHTKSNSSSSFSLSPGFGYFASDRTVLGFQGHLGKNWSKSFDGNGEVAFENSWSSYGGGVFVRSYFPLAEKVAAFGEFGLDYVKDEYWRDDKTFSTDIELGMQYLVSKKIAVHVASPIVYFQSSKLTDSGPVEYSPRNEFSFQFLDSFSLGATIFL